jgi:hypothetical protein
VAGGSWPQLFREAYVTFLPIDENTNLEKSVELDATTGTIQSEIYPCSLSTSSKVELLQVTEIESGSTMNRCHHVDE